MFGPAGVFFKSLMKFVESDSKAVYSEAAWHRIVDKADGETLVYLRDQAQHSWKLFRRKSEYYPEGYVFSEESLDRIFGHIHDKIVDLNVDDVIDLFF